MSWSIFTDGGGDGAAETWAEDEISLLESQGLNVPNTPGVEQFLFDWEKSEGGGGKFNPLNQGPVPNDPSLTTTGQQYGGGAADYASVGAGLQGAADYLQMSNYSGVLAALEANDPAQAEQALWASPWASGHYGYGSAWSTDPLPGQASAIQGTDSTPASGSTSLLSSTSSGTGVLDASYTKLGTFGTVMQSLDNIFNPDFAAVPGFFDIFGGASVNKTVNAAVTIGTRTVGALIGTGMFAIGVYMMIKGSSAGAATGAGAALKGALGGSSGKAGGVASTAGELAEVAPEALVAA